MTWSGASDTTGIGGYSIGWGTNPIGLPEAQRDLPASAISTISPALANGVWYFHIRTVDDDGNWTSAAAHLGPFKIDTTPPQSTAQPPLYAVGPFTVTWSGTDVGSNIAGYDIWTRDGTAAWTKWLTSTLTISGMFTGTIGHTYSFRSQAIDAAQNLETDMPLTGDTLTTIAAFQIDGQVFNNRHAPIFNARVEAQPAALTATHTNVRGAYTLYFIDSGVYTLIVSRADFGLLPPLHSLTLTRTQPGPDFVLPPLNDAVINGDWETGDFTGWIVDPAIAATVDFSAAHTGWYGLHLTAPLTGTDFLPVLTQTFTVTGVQPTLSLMYRVTEGNGDPFFIALTSDSEVITHELIMTPTAWSHTWVDLAPFAGKVLTVSLGFQNPAVAQQIDLDEISGGAAQSGVYPVFLPVARRNS